MQTESFEFKHRFIPPFVATLMPAAPLGLLAALVTVRVPVFMTRREIIAIFIRLLGGALAVSLFAAFATKLLTVRLSPPQIRCYNFWGVYRSVAWTDIERAHPSKFLGMPYVRVWSRGRRTPMWVPLFLTDMQGFRAMVLHQAGSDNPLSRCLLDKGA